MRMLTMAGVCLLAAATAHAQDPQERAGREKVEVRTAQGMVTARVPLERTMTGAPYSADTVTENTQTLADGNRIARKVTGRVYRDSEGRTRREEDHADGTSTISIIDPVADVSYRLDPQQHIAWKTQPNVGAAIMNKVELDVRQRAERERNAAARADGLEPVRPEPMARGGGMFKVADPNTPVETKTLEGIQVQGRKTTTTIPAGQIGNDLPISITSEEWSSPDLKILVLTRYADPRMGESIYRLTNIVRAEPDTSLFQVPPGYTIKETGVRRNEPQR